MRNGVNIRPAAIEFEAEVDETEVPFGEFEALNANLPARTLTYTTRDVIDRRISVPAQHSLVRLSKNPATSADAIALLAEVKAGRLGGIFCVNWQKPAQRAIRLGKSWWTAIPRGEDAVLMLDPDNPLGGQPLIAFRRELDPRPKQGCGRLKDEKLFPPSPLRLDAALRKAWTSYQLLRTGQLIQCPDPRRNGTTMTEASFRHPLFIAPVIGWGCSPVVDIPMKITVWAENKDAPGIPCEDARLRENGSLSKRSYPDGTASGHAGWDWGISFNHLGNLVTKLTILPTPSRLCGNILFDCPEVQPGQVFRLAICAHGAPGEFEIDGRGKKLLTAVRIRTIKPLRNLLKEIGNVLSDDAVVLLMGCNAGAGTKGSDLLIELSKIWPNRKVVGFTRIMTFGWGRKRLGDPCSEPGYRDTNETEECPGRYAEQREKCELQRYTNDWNDLIKLPWGSEFSPHAKVAQNGKILNKGGEP
jgi:Domain of unknown function (DUF4347)